MTMRTRYKVECACGHVGYICMRENDQPYSKNWERYTVEDLHGGSTGIEGGFMSWDQVFADIKPVCPRCSAALTPTQLK